MGGDGKGWSVGRGDDVVSLPSMSGFEGPVLSPLDGGGSSDGGVWPGVAIILSLGIISGTENGLYWNTMQSPITVIKVRIIVIGSLFLASTLLVECGPMMSSSRLCAIHLEYET